LPSHVIDTLNYTDGLITAVAFRELIAGTNISLDASVAGDLTIAVTGVTGLTDGDKGDITVSSSGTVYTVDAGAISTAKIADAAVTYAKVQDVSAASKLLGRGSASGAGDVEEITVGSGLTMTGTTLSASGGGGTYTLINDTTLGSAQASVTFSSIPNTYKYLVVLFSVRSSDQASANNIIVRFNGDSGSNYDYRQLYSASSVGTDAAAATTGIVVGAFTPTSGPTGAFSPGTFTIFDYASTSKGKAISGTSGRSDTTSAANQNVNVHYGFWRTTGSAVTSLTVLPAAGNLATDCRFTLYGVS
jgi:hypothetical protein